MARWGTDAELEVLVQLNALTVSSSMFFLCLYERIFGFDSGETGLKAKTLAATDGPSRHP